MFSYISMGLQIVNIEKTMIKKSILKTWSKLMSWGLLSNVSKEHFEEGVVTFL